MKTKCVSGFVAFCLLLALALAADAAGPLTGEQASQHLRDTGQYESLAAAMTGARYGAKAVEGAEAKALAQNPAHGLRSTFSREGLRLEVRNGEATHQSAWRLDSLGYGSAQIAVPAGELKVSGQRVEILRGPSPTPHLVEWFHNTPGGLEHGFTLAERPATNPRGEALRLVLAVTGDLAPEADAAGQNLLLRDAAGQTVLTYEKLKVWDATGAELPARMQVANGKVTLAVSESTAHYPLTIDPTFVQQAYVKGSNTGAGDGFGFTVAVSGDTVVVSGDTVVVGAVGEDGGATGVNGTANELADGAGAAYVFVRSGTNWSQQAYLKASQVSSVDNFGYSVAVAGDTVVVGAYREDSGATGVNGDQGNNDAVDAGAAYVFVRSGTNWSQQAYLKASNTGGRDNFGSTVSVSGDTVVVGAISEDGSAMGVNGTVNELADGAGAAYVFVRSGTNWSQQAYLKASQVTANDQFGRSVAVSGDTVVVGATGEDGSAMGVNGPVNELADAAGAAYVFVRSGTNWSQQAYLKASQVSARDNFGQSVAVAGDTVVVGAGSEGGSATGVNGPVNELAIAAGAAYVFVRNGTTWSQQAYLKASQVSAGDEFGLSVAVSGDMVVVGASREEGSATGVNGPANELATEAGAAYVFVRGGTNWSQQAYLKASQVSAEDRFGHSVAVSGDMVVVGAFREDGGATGVNGPANELGFDSGAAYVFYLADGDSDGDGLLDSWETEGGGIDVDGDGIIDLDLYALGARPDHKDLFVEIDTILGESAKLSSALMRVKIAFSQAPVTNLDGAMGIRLHLQLDETDLPFDTGKIPGFKFPLGFAATKAAHFGTVVEHNPVLAENPNRVPILAAKAFAYRYCIVYDNLNFVQPGPKYIGLGEIGGNDFVMHISDTGFYDEEHDIDDLAGVFMHELGHTLGLRHGGADDIHGKPNYPSIMNYALLTPLTWSLPFWRLDYSREPLAGAGLDTLPSLNETSLDEFWGIPSTLYRDFRMPFGVSAGSALARIMRTVPLDGTPVDLDNNGTINVVTTADLNYLGINADFGGVDEPSEYDSMLPHNDWAMIQYKVNPDNTESGAAVVLSEGCPSMDVLSFLEANVPVVSATFAGWINHFAGVGAQTGFNDDPDGDGIPNGIEQFLGTSPGAKSAGLVAGGGSFAGGFQHSRSVMPSTNTVAVYDWSTDLINWHPSGATADGITVTLSPAVIEQGAVTDTIKVIPTITGSTSKLFFRLRVQTQAPGPAPVQASGNSASSANPAGSLRLYRAVSNLDHPLE